jgi:hypothetical protein
MTGRDKPSEPKLFADYARLAAVAFGTAVVAGLVWFANRVDDGPDTVPASCAGFDARDWKVASGFQSGATIAKSGAFARGDHVHLVVDFGEGSFSYALGGAFTSGGKVVVSGSGSVTMHAGKIDTGAIGGAGTFTLDVDVTSAGNATVTIAKTDDRSAQARIIEATCTGAIPAAPQGG